MRGPHLGHLAEPWCVGPQLPSCPAGTQSLGVLVARKGLLGELRRPPVMRAECNPADWLPPP